VGIVAAISFVLLSAGTANASEEVGQEKRAEYVSAVVNQADASVQTIPFSQTQDDSSSLASTDSGVTLPAESSDSVELNTADSDDSFSVELPDLSGLSDATIADDGTAVYHSSDDSTSVAVRAHENGAQILTILNGEDSPSSYTYAVDVPSGGSLHMADDGSVNVLDSDGLAVASATTPWAKDANGSSIPTHYEVDGNSITQIIDRGDTNWKYPIVADPNWWQITKCVGSLAWVVGSAVFSVAKIAKIKKYINAFGGLTKTARLLLGATSAAEKATAIGKGFLTFAASVTGVDGVYTHCIKGK
jgi:hypothetical protein